GDPATLVGSSSKIRRELGWVWKYSALACHRLQQLGISSKSPRRLQQRAGTKMRIADSPHRRLNPLTGEWVLVSPHRTQRPWQGEVSTGAMPQPAYDPGCYLCPGNERAGGARNPQYTSTFVFDNDYPALLPEVADNEINREDLIVARRERGICRVACFSPQHNLTLSQMGQAEVAAVVCLWAEQYAQLGLRDFLRYVQIFENRGAMMGASNPHPHCQIWATETIPNEPAKEQASLRQYVSDHRKCLLCQYTRLETADAQRVVLSNPSFLVVVPFWAIWPFETLVISKRHVPDLTLFTDEEIQDLARALRLLTAGYDRLFQAPFPYSMGFHQQPT